MAKIDLLDKVLIMTNDSFQDNRGQLFTIWKDLTFDLRRILQLLRGSENVPPERELFKTVLFCQP